MKKIILLVVLQVKLIAWAQKTPFIIPQPLEMTPTKGQFSLNKSTTIYYEGVRTNADWLKEYLSSQHQLAVAVKTMPAEVKKEQLKNAIILTTDNNISEGYILSASAQQVCITGGEAGVFYGIQTLIQLIPTEPAIASAINIQGINIIDKPRFQYRGMHLDVGRHFFDVSMVKKYIDYLAAHKFNTLHWHLTEDQGWRIEIKKYPLLTEKGSCRNQTLVGPYGSDKYDGQKYCGFYTQDEIKQVVEYASSRHITIIPEIEMPGHAVAALSSYPFLGCTKGPYKVMETWGVSEDVLCAGNDSTFQFLEGVLDEVTSLFPSKYIHIGGDECPKKRWHECKDCQQRMKELHLKDEMELQSYFIGRIEKYLNKKGKLIIGWDEILEGGLAPNATVMSWRGEDGGIAAAKAHHQAIMTPGKPVYFDHSQSINEDSVTQGGLNTLEDVYRYDPIPKSLDKELQHYIIGAQANMWTEYMNNPRKLEYMLFPRMSALAEVLWTAPEQKDFSRFENNIPQLFKRYEKWNANYSKAYYDIQSKPVVRYYKKNGEQLYPIGINWELSCKDSTQRIFVSRPYFEAENTYSGKAKIPVLQNGIYQATLIDSQGNRISNTISQEFNLNKATGKKITLKTTPSNKYAVGGIFTLVDGIANKVGMSKSAQFLGFEGTDLEAVIDLGNPTTVQYIILNTFQQPESWIYPPFKVSFWISDNGIDFVAADTTNLISIQKHDAYRGTFNNPKKVQFIKIVANNYGQIPADLPGAGNKAWLFADEIEIF